MTFSDVLMLKILPQTVSKIYKPKTVESYERKLANM